MSSIFNLQLLPTKTQQSMKSCWSDNSSDYKNIGGKINIERVFEKRDKVFPKISKLNFLESAIFSLFHYVDLKMSLTNTKYWYELAGKPQSILCILVNCGLLHMPHATCHMPCFVKTKGNIWVTFNILWLLIVVKYYMTCTCDLKYTCNPCIV